MPGDELHEEAGGSAEAVAAAVGALGDERTRTGPRHAAPKKPLLTRLHVPAGKAIAIAAMPSAVLMGMGLTPQLASAKPLPKNPFKSGPCVSQPDKDSEQDAKEKAKDKREKKEKAERAEREKAAAKKREQQKEEAGKDGKTSPEPAPSGGSPSKSGKGDDDKPSGTASPSPSSGDEEESKKNPLDPLGIGDGLKDALTPDEEKEKEAEKSDSPSATPSPSASSDSGTSKRSESPAKPVEDTVNKVGDGVKDAPGKVEKGLKDTAKGVGDAATKAPSKTNEAGADESGKKAYPCVEEKKVDGENERTDVTLPNQPWNLEASSLALHGLNYEGVVNVTTADGSKKQALKFTAKGVDIHDLHQIVAGPGGTKYHVMAAKGSTSTIRGGTVTMYTERLAGNLFGLIPIVFDPQHPPPLNVPEAYFTNVKVQQAGQFGGNLTVPGLHQTITK